MLNKTESINTKYVIPRNRYGGGGGGGGGLLVSCVPMREQKKNDEKGYFLRAGQCAALSLFRVGKMLFL